MTESPHILATTDETFERDVIERSKQTPVVVDFWATWCQPCLMLAPVLEKLAEEFAGKFVLVKAETDHNQSAASEFNVSSIPAVFGVVGGQVVDFFAGVAPETQLREWLGGLVLQGEAQAAANLVDSDPAAAETQYRALIEKLPREPALQIGLGRALAAQQKTADARTIIEQLEARGFLEPEGQKLKAALELGGHEGEDIAAIERRATAAPRDLALQLAWAQALAGAERYEAALEKSLAIVQAERTGPGEAARLLMLDIFRVLPEDSELTSTFRRRLATAMY
jgi:putative thioredoxin